jgi:hypothetical protein
MCVCKSTKNYSPTIFTLRFLSDIYFFTDEDNCAVQTDLVKLTNHGHFCATCSAWTLQLLPLIWRETSNLWIPQALKYYLYDAWHLTMLFQLQRIHSTEWEIFRLLWMLKMAVIWNVAPGNLVDIDQRFRDAYCLYHRPDNVDSKYLWNVG